MEFRTIRCQIKGVDITCYPRKGCPQGAVTSPYLWNDVSDIFLKLFDDHPDIRIEGYADDCVLLISGCDEYVLRAEMQEALKTAENWAKENDLAFSPTKTEAMIFTRKQEGKTWEMPPPLFLQGAEIKYVYDLLYLANPSPFIKQI